MPFGSYSTLSAAARAFRITCTTDHFVKPLPMKVPEVLRSEIAFAQPRPGLRSSEAGVCEGLIFPILKEVWRSDYLDDLMLWSHMALYHDAALPGRPDYLAAR